MLSPVSAFPSPSCLPREGRPSPAPNGCSSERQRRSPGSDQLPAVLHSQGGPATVDRPGARITLVGEGRQGHDYGTLPHLGPVVHETHPDDIEVQADIGYSHALASTLTLPPSLGAPSSPRALAARTDSSPAARTNSRCAATVRDAVDATPRARDPRATIRSPPHLPTHLPNPPAPRVQERSRPELREDLSIFEERLTEGRAAVIDRLDLTGRVAPTQRAHHRPGVLQAGRRARSGGSRRSG
jgi:hypothetical protein